MEINAPIEEAPCELTFTPTVEWDLTLSVQLHLEIQDEYQGPTHKQMWEYPPFCSELFWSLQQDPVIDGFNHAGQTILMKAFEDHPRVAARWTRDYITEPPRPSIAADILRLLGRLRPHTLEWRRAIVAVALKSESIEICDAAIQAVESWADPELVALLRSHSDPASWLADYAAHVVRDLAG